MYTDELSYPVWRANQWLECEGNTPLEYKCVIMRASGSVEWEVFTGNRRLFFAGDEVRVRATWNDPTDEVSCSGQQSLLPAPAYNEPFSPTPSMMDALHLQPPEHHPLMPKAASREPSMLDLSIVAGSRNNSFSQRSGSRSCSRNGSFKQSPHSPGAMFALGAAAEPRSPEQPPPRRIISYLNTTLTDATPAPNGSLFVHGTVGPQVPPTHGLFNAERATSLLAGGSQRM